MGNPKTQAPDTDRTQTKQSKNTTQKIHIYYLFTSKFVKECSRLQTQMQDYIIYACKYQFCQIMGLYV